MQTIKATIKFVDTNGSIFLLSEREGAILLRGIHHLNGHREGDEVTLFREDDQRRMGDWKIEKREGH